MTNKKKKKTNSVKEKCRRWNSEGEIGKNEECEKSEYMRKKRKEPSGKL